MTTMTHLLLLLAVIIGHLHMPAHAEETSSDYENVYDDDDLSHSPANLAKSTPTPMIPYFDQNESVVYVQPNASNVKLNCPAKNYNVDRLTVLWYRNKTLLVNGNHAVIKVYSLESPLVLNAPAVNATGHSFSCLLVPFNLTHQITVKPGPPPSSPSSTASLAPTIILGALLLIHF